MAESVKKLYPRAPRYTLNVDDKRVLRFSGLPRGSKDFFTEIINISESGMAFTLPYLDNPKMGETIKIQFTPPGSKSVACFATIKRIETQSFFDNFGKPITKKVVGLVFTDIHPGHIQDLKSTLGSKFDELRKNYSREQRWHKLNWILRDPIGLSIFTFCSFGIVLSSWIF